MPPIKITNEFIRSLNPCYDPIKYINDSEALTIFEFLKREDIPAYDRLWVTLRPQLLDEKTLRLYAVSFSRYAVSRLSDKDLQKKLTGLLNVSEKYALGQVNDIALSVAEEVAHETADSFGAPGHIPFVASAAYLAARSVAFSAANPSANTTHDSFAELTTYLAARSVAYSAHGSPSISLSGSTAYSAIDDANSNALSILLELLEPTTIAPTELSEPKPDSSKSATKNDKQKPDLSLIPQIAMVKLAEAMMVGEKKYGRYNYCKGHNSSQLIAALLRHATAFNDGEDKDPDDGQSHLGSVMACVAMLLRQQQLGTFKDDRYKQEGTKK